MLNEDQALEIREHYSGKQKRRSYVFACKNTECKHTLRIEKSAFKKVTGFCRSCSRRQKPFRQTYNVLKQNAARRGINFDLSYEELLFLTQIGVCHYCGQTNIEWEPFPSHGAGKTNLDRKDNTKGYTCDNIVVCCKLCNFMKRDWLSYEEFKIVSLLLRRWREGTLEDKQELEYMLSAWNMQISLR